MGNVKTIPQPQVLFLIFGTLLLALACGLNLFLYLDKVPIANWDEARHGVSAYEMLQSGNYLVNTYRNSPDYWNVKPPLSFWAVATGFKVFGVSLFGFRVISSLCTVFTIFLMVLFAGKHLSWSTGLLAGGLLVTANRFVLSHNARSGDPDALFILLTTSAIFAALQAKEHIRWLYLSCFLLALGFLTKSFHVAAPVLTVTGLALWIRGREMFRLHVLCLCLLCGLTPVVLWAAFRYNIDGTIFFEKMWYLDLYNRATSAVEGHTGHALFYFNILKSTFKIPVFVLCTGWLVISYFTFKNVHGKQYCLKNNVKDFILQMLICIVIPFVLFQCSFSKLEWYIYPIMPFIALLIGLFMNTLIVTLWNLCESKYARTMLVFVTVLFFGFQEYRLLRNIVKQTKETDSVQLALQKKGHEIKGVPVYLEHGNWEQKYVLAAKIYGDFLPMDGGMEAWVKAPNNMKVLLSVGEQ